MNAIETLNETRNERGSGGRSARSRWRCSLSAWTAPSSVWRCRRSRARCMPPRSDLQWFSSGYLLVLAAAMLPVGLLGDRFGRKKVLADLACCCSALGSAACAFAPTPAAFIAARFVLGLAGAGIIVMALSALTVLFTEEERPRAVGIWAAANFLALPIGPILGGWLLTHYWWGWVFLINVPVALIGLLAALALVPESRAPARPGLDLVGIVASTAGLVALTYGLIEAGQQWLGRTAAPCIPIGAGSLLLVGFFLWERRLAQRPAGQPLVDLAAVPLALLHLGRALLAVLVLAMIGVLFTLPQYFQGVLGTDAMGSGLRLLPLVGGLIVGAVPADRLARRARGEDYRRAGVRVLALGCCRRRRAPRALAMFIWAVGHPLRGYLYVARAFVCRLGGPRRPGPGAHLRHGGLRRALGALSGAQRRGVRGDAGPAEDRRTAWGGSPGQRAQRPLYQSSCRQPVCRPAVAQGRAREPLRRSRGRRTAPLAGAARVVARPSWMGWMSRWCVAAGIAMAGFVLTLMFLPSRASGESEGRGAAQSSAPVMTRRYGNNQEDETVSHRR